MNIFAAGIDYYIVIHHENKSAHRYIYIENQHCLKNTKIDDRDVTGRTDLLDKDLKLTFSLNTSECKDENSGGGHFDIVDDRGGRIEFTHLLSIKLDERINEDEFQTPETKYGDKYIGLTHYRMYKRCTGNISSFSNYVNWIVRNNDKINGNQFRIECRTGNDIFLGDVYIK